MINQETVSRAGADSRGVPGSSTVDSRRLLRLARRLYAVLLIGLLAWAVAHSADTLRHLVHGVRPWLLVVALVASFGQLTLTSAFWRSGLAALGHPVPFATSLDATLGATPARYLPGSVWYAVGRVARLRESGVPATSLAVVAALEMLLVPVVGFPFGAALVAATGGGGPGVHAWVIVAVVALAVVGSPPVVNRGLRFVATRRGVTDPPTLPWPRHLLLLGWVAAFWMWSSGVFTAYVSAFPDVHGGSLVHVAGAYMIAWGVGWLAIFAPQGAGVFEATIAALLTSRSTAGVAVIVGGYRAVIAVRDGLAYAAVIIWRRRRRRRRRRADAS